MAKHSSELVTAHTKGEDRGTMAKRSSELVTAHTKGEGRGNANAERPATLRAKMRNILLQRLLNTPAGHLST